MRFNPLKRQLSALVPGAIVLCLLFYLNAAAQSVNSTVTGVVRDTAGAVVPGAKVTLIDAATSLSVNTTRNSEGVYLFNEVRSGYYPVHVQATGFKKAEVRDVKEDVGAPATVNVNLDSPPQRRTPARATARAPRKSNSSHRAARPISTASSSNFIAMTR